MAVIFVGGATKSSHFTKGKGGSIALSVYLNKLVRLAREVVGQVRIMRGNDDGQRNRDNNVRQSPEADTG